MDYSTLILWTGPFQVKGVVASCFFLLLPCFTEITVLIANRVDPDQTPHSAASDLGLHRLSMSLVWDARNKWVKLSLRKHAYSNILKIFPPKYENFEIKISDIFHISAQNIDCGYSLEPPRRGGSNKYPQSMFLSRNKKNNVYPCKPQFYYIKVGFKGVKTI